MSEFHTGMLVGMMKKRTENLFKDSLALCKVITLFLGSAHLQQALFLTAYHFLIYYIYKSLGRNHKITEPQVEIQRKQTSGPF